MEQAQSGVYGPIHGIQQISPHVDENDLRDDHWNHQEVLHRAQKPLRGKGTNQLSTEEREDYRDKGAATNEEQQDTHFGAKCWLRHVTLKVLQSYEDGRREAVARW